MMKLALMGMVIGTLDEQRASSIADEIASRWAHDPGTVRFFRASANFLFSFEQAGRPFFLRFIDAHAKSASAIQAEMTFLQHLAPRGVAVSRPIPSLAGRFVESVSTSRGTWNATVFERVTGTTFESDELSPEQVVKWGQALGTLHNAARGYSANGRPSWRDHIARVASGLADDPLTSKLNAIQSRLQQLPVRPDNFGLIHYDFESDNIVWNGTYANIVDFDDCAYYWFAADIAYALRDVFGDSPHTVNWENKTAALFLQGYRSERNIEDIELESIPTFLALHNLVTMTRLQNALEPKGSADDPEWLIALRDKLETKIDFYRAQIETSNVA